MQIGVVGLSFKTAGIEVRERFSKTSTEDFKKRISAIGRDKLHSHIILNTCNRTEIYFHAEDLALAHSFFLSLFRELFAGEFEPYLYSYFGFDCFLHLAKVTAGLDSAVLAETEIQGQVKCAYEVARSTEKLHSSLHFLFQKSLMIGKKVRSIFALERKKPSLERACWEELKEALGLSGKVLFIGASRVNTSFLHYLSSREHNFSVTLTNRTLENGLQAMASIDEIDWLPWHQRSQWHTFDAVVVGTSSAGFVIDRESLPIQGFDNKKLLLDLSVPRNIDPSLQEHPKLMLRNIDYLHQRANFTRSFLDLHQQQALSMVYEETCTKVYAYQQKGKRISLAPLAANTR